MIRVETYIGKPKHEKALIVFIPWFVNANFEDKIFIKGVEMKQSNSRFEDNIVISYINT